MARRRLFGSERNRFRRQLMCGRPWVECHYWGKGYQQYRTGLRHMQQAQGQHDLPGLRQEHRRMSPNARFNRARRSVQWLDVEARK